MARRGVQNVLNRRRQVRRQTQPRQIRTISLQNIGSHEVVVADSDGDLVCTSCGVTETHEHVLRARNCHASAHV